MGLGPLSVLIIEGFVVPERVIKSVRILLQGVLL
jgi:hypothetical protein